MSVEMWPKRDLCDQYRPSTYPGPDCNTVLMDRGRLVKVRKLKPPAALAAALFYPRALRAQVRGGARGDGPPPVGKQHGLYVQPYIVCSVS